MSTNLATLITGPCLVSYDGSTFRSKGDVKLDLALDTFDVTNDLYQLVDKRVSGQPIKVSFQPEGIFGDLAVLFPYFAAALGSFITPTWTCGAVDATANTVALTNTALAAGTPVSFGTTGTMPGGLTAATVYYLSANTSGLRTVHATAAAAIAGTSPIDITSTGSGTLRFMVQKPLTIIGTDGTRVIFANTAVSKMPSIKGHSTDPLWGSVEFNSYPANATPWTTAGAFYSIDQTSFADSGFDPANIITQPYNLAWGATAPWTNFSTKNGVSIEPTMSLDPVEDDASGVISHRLMGISVTAKAEPSGIDLASLMTALKLQGTGATRGRSLAGANLDITATGVGMRLTAAALSGGPAIWGTKSNRVGELTWTATRTFTSGVANPLFYIGTSLPS